MSQKRAKKRTIPPRQVRKQGKATGAGCRDLDKWRQAASLMRSNQEFERVQNTMPLNCTAFPCSCSRDCPFTLDNSAGESPVEEKGEVIHSVRCKCIVAVHV